MDRNIEDRVFELPALIVATLEKLEWSKLCYSTTIKKSVHCCPLCGGINPDEYNRYKLKNDQRCLCGHSQWCSYNIIMKENLQNYTLRKE